PVAPLPLGSAGAADTAALSSATGSVVGLISVMVWLAREDLVRAVDLLEQHHAGELVRQRHRAEREPHVAALEVEPARPADHEAEVPPGLAALLHPDAEVYRVECLPLGAEQHRERR